MEYFSHGCVRNSSPENTPPRLGTIHPGLLRSHLRTGQAVLADRAYDADYVRVQIRQAGAVAVVPGKKNRRVPVQHAAEIYKERNQVERAINSLKRFRAVATRFDKRAANYFATCCLIAALTWL